MNHAIWRFRIGCVIDFRFRFSRMRRLGFWSTRRFHDSKFFREIVESFISKTCTFCWTKNRNGLMLAISNYSKICQIRRDINKIDSTNPVKILQSPDWRERKEGAVGLPRKITFLRPWLWSTHSGMQMLELHCVYGVITTQMPDGHTDTHRDASRTKKGATHNL